MVSCQVPQVRMIQVKSLPMPEPLLPLWTVPLLLVPLLYHLLSAVFLSAVFLSVWLRNPNHENQLDRFERLLRAFPFSKLTRAESAFRILAVNSIEPPLSEILIAGVPQPEAIAAWGKEFHARDSAFQVDAYWDIWRYLDGDWKLHRIEDPKTDEVKWELYDLANDPTESSPQNVPHPERLAPMQEQLDNWLESVARSLNGEDD